LREETGGAGDDPRGRPNTSRTARKEGLGLQARARQEADELGPEPRGREAKLWREERWGAVVLLAGLADDKVELPDNAARLLG
jgi:hypothetical protein